ncbi:MAG: PTS fructose transporter subunit IIA [Clostridiaceae bacterium]|nr:PTS fructose transporter subunit IIA [Clostridiaceae bacterium]
MVSIIVSGHGSYSLGLLDAFEMIFGQSNQVQAIPFFKGEGLPQMQAKFEKVLAEIPDDQAVLFLVDVFGGTPYNAAAQVIYTRPNSDILSGCNLPMLLEGAALQSTLDLAELTKQLELTAIQSHKSFREEMAKQSEFIQESDEGDDLL